MKNILVLSDSKVIAGAEKILINILSGLNGENYRFITVTSEEGPLSERLREKGIQCNIVPMTFNNFSLRYFRHLKVTFELLKLMKKNNIDLIFCNRAIVGKYGSILKIITGKPCIWHLHDIYDNFPGDRLAYFTDKFIAVSNAVKNSFPAKLKDKISVIYNGLQEEQTKSAVDDSSIKNELGISGTEKIVLLPGRITPWKGQKLFIEAAKFVAERRKDIKFLIVGDVVHSASLTKDTEFKRDLINLISVYHLENVMFTGWRDDVNELMNLADVVVNCSIKPEPLATTIIEAMNAGKPVICTPSGGNPELVINNENGIVLGSDDPVEFGTAVLRIFDNENCLINMGKRGKEIAADKFSYNVFISKIHNLIQQTFANA